MSDATLLSFLYLEENDGWRSLRRVLIEVEIDIGKSPSITGEMIYLHYGLVFTRTQDMFPVNGRCLPAGLASFTLCLREMQGALCLAQGAWHRAPATGRLPPHYRLLGAFRQA